MFVCLCMGLTQKDLERAIDQGARTVEDLSASTGAGTCCGVCLEELQQTIDRKLKSPKVQIVHIP